MKKITRVLTLLAVVFAFAVTTTKAQEIYVSARMHRPERYERFERHHPPRPSANHVWVAEEWAGRGRGYEYQPGHWAVPPRPRAWWEKGHWRKRRAERGYVWIPGHWAYPNS